MSTLESLRLKKKEVLRTRGKASKLKVSTGSDHVQAVCYPVYISNVQIAEEKDGFSKSHK